MDVPKRLALRVGALVAAALAVGFVALFILGGEGMMFADKRTYHIAWADVAGLREGADVRLGGRAVGDVSEIAFGHAEATGEALIVTVRVRESFADRVRVDSVARISSQGLLGDKLVEITLGSAAAPPVEPDGWIVGEPPADAAKLMVAATGAAEHARAILARLDDATRDLDAAGALAELEATLATVRRIAERIETGPGTAHELVYDAALAADTSRALRSFDRVAEESRRLMASARRSAEHLERVTGAVDPATVEQVTEDLAAITRQVRSGRGTLGALIADPTLYEETKRILVNIRRNRVLKSLARLVVSESEPEELMDAGPPEQAEQAVEIRPRRAPTPEQIRARSPATRTR